MNIASHLLRKCGRTSRVCMAALLYLSISAAYSQPLAETKTQLGTQASSSPPPPPPSPTPTPTTVVVVGDSLKGKVRATNVAERSFRVVKSIPYPAGALYIERGICGAFLGGKQKNLGEHQSLYQWQGELGYFYKPWFSGGVGFRIKAGEPSDTVQKIQNRYFLLTRFHKSWNTLAFYLGPQLGLDNLNLLNGSPDTGTHILKPIRGRIDDTNASLGLDMGGGWKCSRWIGLTMGSNLEYSLGGRDSLSKDFSLDIHVNPGVAIDILAFSENLRELVQALYFHIDFQSGFLLFEKTHYRQDWAIVGGFGLAF